MSGYLRERQFTAGTCGAHHTLSLSDAAVHCTDELAAGWWCAKVSGDNAWVKSASTVISAITTANGDAVTWMRDGEGEYFHLPDGGYIAAKREGATAVTIHIMRRG